MTPPKKPDTETLRHSLPLRITDAQLAWIKARSQGNDSYVVRQLITEAMARDARRKGGK